MEILGLVLGVAAFGVALAWFDDFLRVSNAIYNWTGIYPKDFWLGRLPRLVLRIGAGGAFLIAAAFLTVAVAQAVR